MLFQLQKDRKKWRQTMELYFDEATSEAEENDTRKALLYLIGQEGRYILGTAIFHVASCTLGQTIFKPKAGFMLGEGGEMQSS